MDPTRGLCLAGGVLLSLVLPLAAGIWQSRTSNKERVLRTVWGGQWLEAVGGLWIIFSPVHPEWGLIAAAVACLASSIILWRQTRPLMSAQT